MIKLLKQEKNEITEYHIYRALAKASKDPQNKAILNKIADQELEHYHFWKNITKQTCQPDMKRVKFYYYLAKILGLSFALRLMEPKEDEASKFYNSLKDQYPGVQDIEKQELDHEQQLISMLNDQRLNYAGSVVLGLNDALVEFTGSLAGLTFAFNNNKIVGATGLVMGFAAALSMAASGYLSSKESDQNDKINPITAAIYTGMSYLITVFLLVAPYLLQDNPYIAIGSMLLITISIIALYTYYISVAKKLSFNKRFLQMAFISLGVAAISYGIGVLIKNVFGITM
jgi:VIT1/CCC1 family predicted Fe2+/Mn2+ transporter